MSVTPGIVYLRLAISGLTLWPGNCPPSPGFAPWANFICISSALLRYSGVTPNLPEAICFIFDLCGLFSLSGFSPPSPEFDLPPNLFIASAKAS